MRYNRNPNLEHCPLTQTPALSTEHVRLMHTCLCSHYVVKRSSARSCTILCWLDTFVFVLLSNDHVRLMHTCLCTHYVVKRSPARSCTILCWMDTFVFVLCCATDARLNLCTSQCVCTMDLLCSGRPLDYVHVLMFLCNVHVLFQWLVVSV